MKKIVIDSLFLVGVMAMPSVSHAQAPFGGFEVSVFPCTCTGQSLHFFAPLFLGPFPSGGALTYPMGVSTAFPFWVLHPGAWALGLYTPGVQACWVWAGKFCFPLPSLGAISPFTGTSL